MSPETKDSIRSLEFLAQAKKFSEILEELKTIQNRENQEEISLEEGEIYYFSALAYHGLSQYADALVYARQAFNFFRERFNHKRFAQSQYLLGLILSFLGDLKQAEIELRDAVASYRRIDDTVGVIACLNRLANVYFNRSEFSKTTECLNQAIEFCRLIGDNKRAIILTGNLGRVFIRLGKLEEAENSLSLVLNEAPEKDEDTLAHVLLSCGYVKFLKREFAPAQDYLNQAKNLIEKNNLVRDKAIYFEYAGELAFAQKEFEKAESFYNSAIEILERIAPQSSLALQPLRLLSELLIEKEEWEKALALCQKGIALALSDGEKIELGALYRASGLIYLKRGECEKARGEFKESVSILEEIGAKYELGKTYLAAGSSSLFEGNEALRYSEQAKDIFQNMGVKYYIGKAWLHLAEKRAELGEFDLAIFSLNAIPKSLTPEENEELLQSISELRKRIEEEVSEASLSSANEYKLFRKHLSEGEYKEIEKGSIEESLEVLAKRVKANRGFVIFRETPETKPGFASLYNLNQEKALEMTKSLKVVDPNFFILEKPFISTNGIISSVSENGNKVCGIILIPLKIGEEINGYLYLDRFANAEANPTFSQKEFNFAVAFADVMAFKLAEIEKRNLEEENLRLKSQLEEKCAFPNIITQNGEMLKLLWKIKQVKDSNLPILLEGETGTGKDFIAKAIHYNSIRKNKRFIGVNCAALPETLLESELFGHKKGSYTGATFDKPGLIEEADGGTLYLDEVGDMSMATQIKLLRVLEEKELTRLGETKGRKIDIRIIAATNRNVSKEVEKGNFRKDLFFRLNAVNVKLLALRERKEDIPLLISHFLKNYAKSPFPVPAVIIELFAAYDWPGNVRELENEVRRIVAFQENGIPISLEVLSEKFSLPENVRFETPSLYDRLAMWEKQYILKALTESKWIRKSAAQSLHIPESSLRFKMKQHHLVPPQK
jgi:two-component system response regulator PilR (NtrC family)